MKVTYDEKAHALYVCVNDKKYPSKFGVVKLTKELIADTVYLDFDADGDIYGIEVLGIEDGVEIYE